MVYFVFVLGAANLSLIQLILDLIASAPLVVLAWHGALFVGLSVIAVGIFLRQAWAYSASLVALLVVLATAVFGSITGRSIEQWLTQLSGREFFLELAAQPYAFVVSPLQTLLRALQIADAILGLFYGVFRVSPDFARDLSIIVAQVDSGLTDASQFYEHGQRYASQGMWASAVLHWRRAAALEPARAYYQRKLGEGYARLGFFERSLDVLESARRFAVDPSLVLEIDRLTEQVRQMQSPQAAAV
jgi:tetratricopeptide (TPR) repeat protein